MKIAGGHKEADLRDSCKMCHKPIYLNILDSWKKQVAKGRGAAEAKLNKLDSQLKQISLMTSLNPAERISLHRRVSAKLAEARKSLETVALDQSGGIHNVPYAMGLIERAGKSLRDVKNTLSLRAPSEELASPEDRTK
jgi:hypothetical protein